MNIQTFAPSDDRVMDGTFLKSRHIILFLILALSTFTATSAVAQSPDEIWRRMYPHLECAALAESGALPAVSAAHLAFALRLLEENPTVFSQRVSDFVPNGSEADAIGRPASAGVDPRFALGRIFQVIAVRTRLRIDGPPEIYPEGMTVSPASENVVIRQRNFATAYDELGCSLP